jgi:hypothetical protein
LVGFDRLENLSDGDFELASCSGLGDDGRFLLASSLGAAASLEGVRVTASDAHGVDVELPGGRRVRVEFAPQLKIFER